MNNIWKIISLFFAILLIIIFPVVSAEHLKCYWCHSSVALRNPDCEKVTKKSEVSGAWCKVESHLCYTFNTTQRSESIINAPFLARGCIRKGARQTWEGTWVFCTTALCNNKHNYFGFQEVITTAPPTTVTNATATTTATTKKNAANYVQQMPLIQYILGIIILLKTWSNLL
ncbi:hypothetical protein L9F63_020035 [Diploptera punctata]|uniref:Uncharacterized protein n=1 Tax=Diploptera punctata TaxID=6984 RepID=A0AAD7ZTC9_DIPPU|nr:hypothetical protein L9F63_020035 [Diploptera punctata]